MKISVKSGLQVLRFTVCPKPKT